MFYVTFSKEQENPLMICGTDRQRIFRDLKTVKGVLNRCIPSFDSLQGLYKNTLKYINVYQAPESAIFDDSKYRLIQRIERSVKTC